MKAVDPAPKRLILCCDGTWQSSVSGKRNIPSNIARLARQIAKAGQDDKGKTWQQLVWYDSGVGTGSLSWIEQARQGGTGDGLVQNVLEAYNFLVNNYAQGDQIYCFGFSRGAFTARAIAGLVTDIGIFKPDNMQLFAPLWALYQKNTTKGDFRKSKAYFQFMHGIRPMVPKGEENNPYVLKPWEVAHVGSIAAPVSDNELQDPLTYENSNIVEAVGVFDTVGSLGMADTRLMSHAETRTIFEYLNVSLSPFIKHAFHALALDDHREPFLPTLWYIPNKATLAAEEALIDKEDDDWPQLEKHRKAADRQIAAFQKDNPPDLYQVWFPGVHINIGGGSDADSSDNEGLSNVTYAWMVQQLGPYLAFEPWTWGQEGIAGYQRRVIQEEKLYNEMKNKMTRDEEKQFGTFHEKGKMESIGDAFQDTASSILSHGKKMVGWKKETQMVPARNIVQPTDNGTDQHGRQISIRWAISEIQDSYTALYKAFSNPVDRTPGQCTDRSREDGKSLKVLGQTNEYIHPAVWWRYTSMKNEKGDMKYISRALGGFKREQEPTHGSWGYRKGNIWIPEWFMKPTNRGLDNNGLGSLKDPNSEEAPWQHAEWSYTENTSDGDALQPELAKVYGDAMKARTSMQNAGKIFPFGV